MAGLNGRFGSLAVELPSEAMTANPRYVEFT